MGDGVPERSSRFYFFGVEERRGYDFRNSPLQALLCPLLHSCPSSLLSAVFENSIWRKGLERCKWQCKAVPEGGPLNVGSETRRKFGEGLVA
jgi:hypothetical protein